uniref:GTPase activating protein (SH3 domain) binding protein 1 n=1 Tax=Seriola lalandi dorsalis TaxID=1841481 RepID=A0A3B4XJN7_SERLL
MVMEKPSAQLVGREFVRQYYTLLNQAPDYLHFYGKNSSYVHGGLDSNGKPVEAVYGQSEIHKRVMALSFRDCHTKIRHVDAHATLNEGVVVQVMGELSNNMQPMRKFMQTFVLAPEGTVANKFYVHNDVFRYQDEVFGDSDSEPPESEDEVEEIEERVPSPDVAAEESAPFYDPTASEPAVPGDDEEAGAASPEPEPEVEKEAEAAVVELKSETLLETQTDSHTADDQTEKSPAAAPPTTEPASVTAEPAPAAPEENRLQPFSWASVTSKNLPPSGAVPVSGIPPHVVKVTPTAPVREGEQGESEGRRVVRYPDAHQLFVGNVPHDVDKTELKEFFEYGTVLELRINSGGKLPNFGFVVFDDSEPVQKILSNRPIKFRGDVRLNVEEKKTRSAREGDRRDVRPRGPGGPGGPRERIGGGGGPRGPPTRGGMAQKPSFGSGRGAGPSDGRYSAQRQ